MSSQDTQLRYCCIKLTSKTDGPALGEIFLLGFDEEDEFQQFVVDSTKELGTSVKYLDEGSCGLGTGGGLYKFKDTILEG